MITEWHIEKLAISKQPAIRDKEDNFVAAGMTEYAACLIVTAVNACQHINPDNPQAVAESITKLYEALREAEAFTKQDDRVHFKVSQVLSEVNNDI